MFGWFKKQDRGEVMRQVANQLAQHLATFCGGPLANGFLIRIDSDPYLAGWIDGKTGGFLVAALQDGAASREALAEELRGALALTVNAVFGKDGGRSYIASTRKHRNERSQEYIEGQKNGQTITRYYTGLADVSADPNYARALQLGRKSADMAQSLGVASTRLSDNEAALIGLEELWYHGRAK